MEGFRPISLCDVLYKIISIVIVNRLKLLLPLLVYMSQTSFVEGHQIVDVVIVVQEIIHSLRS